MEEGEGGGESEGEGRRKEKGSENSRRKVENGERDVWLHNRFST